ncbi:Tat pathway signal protein [Streptomyces albipurpureus]|uniref:Tat pathway signal protein n=1 Tax=Streptomyces albipurpureus TaxID=2897419 RepID=A0ABT0UJH4_9ACTN|nr:Tat pathway signal protein [Streptomyces sp. CWNU-1]MCM2388783.1 Tat pathway signal protein [Streptomyces sp. CWNU-1]
MARTRNTLLAAAIKETGWSQTQAAAHFGRVATETGAHQLQSVSRSHIAMWIGGTQPEARAASILCETLSRKLGRVVTPEQIGLAPASEPLTQPGWDFDTLTTLTDLGSTQMDKARRRLLATSAYSVAGAALPPQHWWERTFTSAQRRKPYSRHTVTAGHLDAVREAGVFFSRRDQRLGGAAGRTALITYLQTDVAEYLSGHIPSEPLRKDLTSAAAELAYLAGWMAFDSSQHALAQHFFRLATRMAAEADDAPLAGHILRAMAHQAVDLGHPTQALELADASVAQRRYTHATPRERALLGVVHGKALAAAGHKKPALAALLRAEDDLRDADNARTEEPGRVFFFGEASLAHETACALRDLGDLGAAEKEFRRSVRTRRAEQHARTHAVTLGYLGAVQARQGHLEAACGTWSQALDAMTGVQSGRTRDTVVQMRRTLSPLRGRGGSRAAELDQRAAAVLRNVG